MRRYVVNYAGAWLGGFVQTGLTLNSDPRAVNRKIPTYAPIWVSKDERKDYGQLALSIVDVIRRGGIDCEVSFEP